MLKTAEAGLCLGGFFMSAALLLKPLAERADGGRVGSVPDIYVGLHHSTPVCSVATRIPSRIVRQAAGASLPLVTH